MKTTRARAAGCDKLAGPPLRFKQPEYVVGSFRRGGPSGRSGLPSSPPHDDQHVLALGVPSIESDHQLREHSVEHCFELLRTVVAERGLAAAVDLECVAAECDYRERLSWNTSDDSYQALPDGRELPRPLPRPWGFSIADVGRRYAPQWQDVGIESYRWAG